VETCLFPFLPILTNRLMKYGRGARMMDEEHKAEWRVLGKSIRGASHVRTGLPNQDAIR
jgi:hypothetical protein